MKPKTKYNSLRSHILSDIEKGVYQEGGQLPGERVLANRYQVAHMTMRQAISMLVDEGVLERRPRVGTFLRSQTTVDNEELSEIKRVVVLLPRFKMERRAPVQHGVLEAVHDVVSAQSYSTEVQYYESIENLASRLHDCAATPGIMVIAWYIDSPETRKAVEKIQCSQTPVVLIDSHLDELCDFVVTDNRRGAADVVQHLHDTGHAGIAYLTSPCTTSSLKERQQGVIEKARELGMACSVFELPGSPGSDELKSLLNYLAGSRTQAVFTCNDHLAIECLELSKKLNLPIPETFSLVGFDDIDISAPLQLTTVRQDFWEMGRQAALQLLKVIKAAESVEPVGLRLVPELKQRSTCRSLADVTVS